MARTQRRGQESSRRTDERGVTAVIVAVMAGVLVISAAFVVDLGLQRVLRRDLQALADVVALDLARDLTGQSAGAYSAAEKAALDRAKEASLKRNSSLVGGEVPAGSVDWEFVVRDSDGSWTQARPVDVPGGVRVTASSEVDFAFAGITGTDKGSATRQAVASARTSACLKVSSYAAQLDTGRSWLLEPLLGDLLGTDLGLKVLDPEQGLASVDLSLLRLIEELDPLVGADISVLSFTQAAGVSVGLSELMLAAINVLEKDSNRLAEVDLLRQVAGGIQANLPGVDIKLAELVELDMAQDAAAELDLNLLDLVAGSLAIANGQNVLKLPLNVKLPLPIGPGGSSLVDLAASVKVGQQPVVKCAGKVESSQIEVTLAGDLLALDLGLVKVDVPLSIKVTLADASAIVSKVRCTPVGKRVDLLIDSGLLGVDVRLGQRADDPASKKLRVALLDVGLPGWKGIEVVSGTIALTSGQSLSRPTREGHIDIVDEDYDVRLPASAGGLGIPTLGVQFTDLALLGGLGPLSDLLKVLGIGSLLNWTTNLVLDGLVNPLVNTLDKWLLDPLLGTLGIDLAGGTIEAAPTVDCGTPRLTG